MTETRMGYLSHSSLPDFCDLTFRNAASGPCCVGRGRVGNGGTL